MQCYTGPYFWHMKVISPKNFLIFKLFIKGFIKVNEIGNWIVAVTVANRSLNIFIN